MMNTNQSNTHANVIYSPDNSTTAIPLLQSIYNPPHPHGEVGWICPVCGRGNAPSTAYCNCKLNKPDIVYANGGLTTEDLLGKSVPCQAEDYTATSAISISSKSTDKGTVYGAYYDMHN